MFTVVRYVTWVHITWTGIMAVLLWMLPAIHYTHKKVKGLDTCYSSLYMSQTQEQQRFTISELAADWYELMIPQPSVAHANLQLDPRCS